MGDTSGSAPSTEIRLPQSARESARAAANASGGTGRRARAPSLKALEAAGLAKQEGAQWMNKERKEMEMRKLREYKEQRKAAAAAGLGQGVVLEALTITVDDDAVGAGCAAAAGAGTALRAGSGSSGDGGSGGSRETWRKLTPAEIRQQAEQERAWREEAHLLQSQGGGGAAITRSECGADATTGAGAGKEADGEAVNPAAAEDVRAAEASPAETMATAVPAVAEYCSAGTPNGSGAIAGEESKTAHAQAHPQSQVLPQKSSSISKKRKSGDVILEKPRNAAAVVSPAVAAKKKAAATSITLPSREPNGKWTKRGKGGKKGEEEGEGGSGSWGKGVSSNKKKADQGEGEGKGKGKGRCDSKGEEGGKEKKKEPMPGTVDSTSCEYHTCNRKATFGVNGAVRYW